MNGIEGIAPYDVDRNREVLQLVVHEVDMIVLGALGQQGKCFRHGRIAEAMGESLGMDRQQWRIFCLFISSLFGCLFYAI